MPEPMADLRTDADALVLVAGPIAPHGAPTSDGAWDGPANEARLPSPMSVATARRAYAWMDTSKVQGGEIHKTDARFIHHEVAANGTPGPANLTACSSGCGILNGGRQGTTIPDADRPGVHAHLAGHLRDGGKTPPPLKGDADVPAVGRHPAFEWACSVPWAIEATALQTILAVAAREHEYDPAAVAAQLGRPLDHSHTVTVRGGVAIIPVEGPIFRRANMFTEISGATSVEILAQDLRTALADPQVTAILLNIDSPGGQANGIAEFAQHVFDARTVKPIAAYVGGMGASAAYWIASAASEVVISPTAMVGSIGVVSALPAPGSSAREITFVSSQSPHKRPDLTTDTGRAQVQATVDAQADVFIDHVARNRGVSPDTVIQDFGQGWVKVGEAAVASGLADRLGSFEGTVAALQARTGPANGGVHMGLKDRWEQFKASLTPQEMAELEPAPPPAPVVDPAAAARMTALEGELAATKAEAAARAAEVQQAQERLGAMEAAARRERFKAEVLGKSDANHRRWVGPPDKHIAMLERLAGAFGEDSEAVADYLEQNRAHAAQIEPLLQAQGRDGSDSDQSIGAQIEAKAVALAAERGITREQATVAVLAAEPALAQAYRDEQRGRR